MRPTQETATGTGLNPGVGNDVYAPLRDYAIESALPGFGDVFYWFNTLWNIYSLLAFLVSAGFIFGIIYAMQRTSQLAAEHAAELRAAEKAFANRLTGASGNTRWQEVKTHIASGNPNDWRLAIIEADIMLDEVLGELGLAGATIGEKLKSASPNQIRSLDDAWRAHRTRNEIAHAGTDFVLTQRIATDTINQYERVFSELGKV